MNVLESLTTILAALIGLLVFKQMNVFYRLLYVQTVIYLILDCIGYLLQHITRDHNSWIYNIVIVIETAFLLYAAQVYFSNATSRFILSLSFFFFITVYTANIVFSREGFWGFAFYGAISECVIITCVFLLILCVEFMRKEQLSSKLPMLLIAIGMILYFAGSIPDLSAAMTLEKQDPELNKKLFLSIVVVLAEFRYLFVAIAFFLMYRNTKTLHKKPLY